MANLKEIRGRIVTVQSTQQITRAMKMVAAAKLRRAQDNILRLRPYASKLEGILSNVTASLDGAAELELTTVREEVKGVLVVVITSDRGLCGGFNNQIGKGVIAHINKNYAAQQEAGQVEVLSIGKKGRDYFKKRGYAVSDQFTGLFLDLNFEAVREAAQYAIDGFLSGKYDRVEIAYNAFKNAATQIMTIEPFLPIPQPEGEGAPADYIMEPDVEYILSELVPTALRIRFYRAVLESNAAEHGARMTAMDKATDNAGELLSGLRKTYNRTRQAAITTEITEIVGGAEALANG